MSNKHKILLTGATGYVGGRLLPRLEQQGYQVRCLTRRPEALTGRVSDRSNTRGVLDAVVTFSEPGSDPFLEMAVDSTGHYSVELNPGLGKHLQPTFQRGPGHHHHLSGRR